MIDAFLGLGGNLGDAKRFIDDAVELVADVPGTKLIARSSYYRTEPVGPVDQPWFLNIAVEVLADLSHTALSEQCKAIEARLGRDRSKETPWGPRVVDVDLVAIRSGHSLEMQKPDLAVPDYLVVPLAEIAPHLLIRGRSLSDLVLASPAIGVEKLNWPVPPWELS